MKHIKHVIIYTIVLPCIIVCASSQSARAQYLQSPLSYEGGSDARIYSSDTIMLENTIIDDASGIQPMGGLNIDTTYMYSPYFMILFLGMEYSLADFCQIGFTLPYIFRTLTYSGSDYHKRGYGDTMMDVSFFFNIMKILDSTTSIKMTFPTGDPMAQDGSYVVPTGYGAFTYSLLESVSYKLPDSVTRLPFRFFANFGFTYYSEAVIESSSTTRLIIEDGISFSFLLGAEYTIFDYLKAQLKFNLLHMPGSNYKISTTGIGSTDWIERNDKITASDMILAIKFNIREYVSGYISFVLPMMEVKEDAVPDDLKRKWKILMGFNKTF
ncbi:MAG: hypothetical protein CVV44_01135 [Spirochaetae bacterium HGW-Spirochaetae-1]|nr:MAG: hypothetical protein CVV44_01135 [Spirochaetae bacterium HGW-Spirochaetae-1]